MGYPHIRAKCNGITGRLQAYKSNKTCLKGERRIKGKKLGAASEWCVSRI